jgi:23S rRNA (uracil1939-C5)-methyltransferase
VNVGEIQFAEGSEFLTENILGIDYQISPFSFFQTNSSQLDTFIQLILDSAKLEKTDIVWDLYCGTGSITLPASKKCSQIFGIELAESSVADAKKNAKNNNITNAEFFAADLHNKKIPDLLKNLPKPDVIIVDPPRNGMHANLINHILETDVTRLIYVSCNPATQARDLEFLSQKYNLSEVFPVDMFPHSYHIENVAVLEKIK